MKKILKFIGKCFKRLTKTRGFQKAYAIILVAANWIAAPRVQTWFNGIFTAIWLVMMPITVIFLGPFSTVLWVSFISAWALFATHLGAWIAALVNVKAERIEASAEVSNSSHFDRIEAAEGRIIEALERLRCRHGEVEEAD